MKKYKILLSVLIILIFAPLAFPETINLKSGKILEADIIQKADKHIKVDIGIGIELTYFLDDIESINGKDPVAFLQDFEIQPRPIKEPEALQIEEGSIIEDGIVDIQVNNIEEVMEVYQMSHDAQKTGDVQTLLEYVTSDRRKEMENDLLNTPDEEREMMIGMLRTMTPTNYVVVRHEISPDGNRAVLYLQGIMKNFFTDEDQPANGEATFVKEDGQWKIQEESWKQ